MTDENARANALDEMAHASEALAAAKCLLDGGFYRDAVSRAYYSAFHAAHGLLLSKGLDPRTHRGTVQLFSLHFVKDGPLTEAAANMLAHLETYRELSDYTSSVQFTRDQASQEIERAASFVALCSPLLSPTPS